ncbi:hypothetical protein PGQ11_002579 [Apiospora arundinis]|uniref:Uncharacterized protein n=1 Tax=Apiospora arundinis TaxID=335852 RepID=A0ABR2JIK6_9PEZI
MSGNAGANNNQPGSESNADSLQQALFQGANEQARWLASQQAQVQNPNFQPANQSPVSMAQTPGNTVTQEQIQQVQQEAEERVRWLESQQASILNQDFPGREERRQWMEAQQNQIRLASQVGQAQGQIPQASTAGNNDHRPFFNRALLDLISARQLGAPPVSSANNNLGRPQAQNPFAPPARGASNNVVSHQGPNPAMPPPPPIRRGPRPNAPLAESRQVEVRRQKASLLHLCYTSDAFYSSEPIAWQGAPCYTRRLDVHQDSWCQVTLEARVCLVTPTWGTPFQDLKQCPGLNKPDQANKNELLGCLQITVTLLDLRGTRVGSPQSSGSEADNPSPPGPVSQLKEFLPWEQNRPLITHVRIATEDAPHYIQLGGGLEHCHFPPGGFPEILQGAGYLATNDALRNDARLLFAESQRKHLPQGGFINAIKQELRKALRWRLSWPEGANATLNVAQFNALEGDFLGAVRPLDEAAYLDALGAGFVELQRLARQYDRDMKLHRQPRSFHDAQEQRRPDSTHKGKEVLREIESASGVRVIQKVIEPLEKKPASVEIAECGQTGDRVEGEENTDTSSLLAAELWQYPWPVPPGSTYSRASSVFDTSSTNRSRSSAPSDASEASVDMFQPPTRPKPVRYVLPCEFRHIASCKEQFPLGEFDAWVEHIADTHLRRIYLDRWTCWFCDAVNFVATRQGLDAETNFRNRMAHIRDHIAQGGMENHKGRPDWDFLEHLWHHGLIDESIYTLVKGYKKSQAVDGEVSWDFRPPSQERREELGKRLLYDMTKENRAINRHKANHASKEDRSSSVTRSLQGEDNRQETRSSKGRTNQSAKKNPQPTSGPTDSPDAPGQSTNNQGATILTTLRIAMLHRYSRTMSCLLWPYQSATSMFWPRISSGYGRVRWNCKCGKPLYLDFADAEMGAAVAYAQSASGGSSPVSVTRSAPGGLRRDDSRSSMNTQQTAFSSITDNGSTTTSPTQIQEMPNYPPTLAQDTKQYLLLCAKTGSNQIKLEQIDLTHVVDNAMLYHRIRTEYHKLRRQTKRNIFLVPTRVEYVNFELIQRRQTGECVGNYQIDSIPSIKEVMARQYTFWPCPPAIGSVPIQSHIFMHSFLTPGDHGTTRDFERLPKKVNTKLTCSAGATNARQVPMGWGIYIVEDLNTPLLASLLLAILLLVLIVTAVWSIHKDDIQGGMGIGQFAIAFVTGVLATGALRNKASLGAG